jgi:hypothetical protein
MAATFNGIGTTFYGRCAFRADGTFQTTKWFVFGQIPIVPLSSCRVARNTDQDVTALIYTSEGYYLIEELPLDSAQVMRTYAFTVLYIAWLILAGWLFVEKIGVFGSGFSSGVVWSLIGAFALLCGAPFMALFWRRKVAMQLAASAPQG